MCSLGTVLARYWGAEILCTAGLSCFQSCTGLFPGLCFSWVSPERDSSLSVCALQIQGVTEGSCSGGNGRGACKD